MVKYYIDRRGNRLSAFQKRNVGWYSTQWWTIIENFTCRECKARPGGHLTLEGACETHAAIMTVVSMNPDKFLKTNKSSTIWGGQGQMVTYGYSNQKPDWDAEVRYDVKKKIAKKIKYYNTTKFEPAVAPYKAAIRKAERERDKFIAQAHADLEEVTILDKRTTTKTKKKK